MQLDRFAKITALVWAALLAGFGCASKEPVLPPPHVAPPARTPAEVLNALPGVWTIDVRASAESMARAQFEPRRVTVFHRESNAPGREMETTVAERFDPQVYREARDYWTRLLRQSDMKWKLTFKPDGTGEHLAIIKTGSDPVVTPFKWRLNGYLLRIDYPKDAKFRSFEVEMPSAVEFNYPMRPLGDHLVLRRENK